MSKLLKFAKEVEEHQKKFRKEAKEILKEGFSEFFEANPEAEAIVWVAFTPYFNDGDTCTFSMHEPELKVNKNKISDVVFENKYYTNDINEYHYGEDCFLRVISRAENKKIKNKFKKLENDYDELVGALGKIEDVLKDVLGDHIKAVVTRKGIKITKYEHE